jgi:TusA-related sulfurtransferase
MIWAVRAKRLEAVLSSDINVCSVFNESRSTSGDEMQGLFCATGSGLVDLAEYQAKTPSCRALNIDMCPATPTPDHHIDISSETCPMTFVLVRLALDQMKAGQVLEIRLRGAEPRRNVPLTAQEQGHEIIGITDEKNGESIILLRRG